MQQTVYYQYVTEDLDNVSHFEMKSDCGSRVFHFKLTFILEFWCKDFCATVFKVTKNAIILKNSFRNL